MPRRAHVDGFIDDSAASFRDRFNAAVAQLDAQVTALNQKEAELWEVQPTVQASGDARLLSDWQNAMNRIIAMNSTVDSIRGQVATVVQWWGSVKGSFSIQPAQTGGALSGALALIPAIPWSVIALLIGGSTAIAGVLYAASLVINRARQYMHQADVDEAVREGREPPPDVAPEGTGIGDGLSAIAGAVPWIIGGAVVLMLLNQTKE